MANKLMVINGDDDWRNYPSVSLSKHGQLGIHNNQIDVCSWKKSLNIIEPRFFLIAMEEMAHLNLVRFFTFLDPIKTGDLLSLC